MEVQRIPNRLLGPFIVICLVAAVVGPTALLVNGPTGLAWGLGWGLSAGVGWTLLCNARWGLVQGLGAGMFVGIGLGSYMSELGILLGIATAGLLWGGLAGFAGMLFLRSVRRTGFRGLLGHTFGGAFAGGVLGTVVTGLIGGLLESFSLSPAGFVIGVVFMCPCWAFGNGVGVVLGHLIWPAGQSDEVRA